MTTPTLSTVDNRSETVELPAPVVKLLPPLARQLAESTAEQVGACVRPIAVRRIDEHTGERLTVPIPCGSTRASVCPSCADKARRLRMWQAREGWHLTEEPRIETIEPTQHQRALYGQLADMTDAHAAAAASDDTEAAERLAGDIRHTEQVLRHTGIRGQLSTTDTHENEKEQKPARRIRSTRRRQDVPDLPRKKVTAKTTGRVFAAPDGKTYCPSTFLTLTLPSYGRVHGDGTPIDPESYDYRRAARDAIHFGELVDRFWQNLRRTCGWNVQYFATVEPQQRLAMHLHAAVRGTIPRSLLRQVVEATYHQVWWPEHDQPVYQLDRLPIWDDQKQSYADPDTDQPLTSWATAIDATLDPTTKPAHVVAFGHRGIDVQGVLGGTDKAGKCLGYLVKYLTKDIGECYQPDTSGQQAHVDRLADALRYEPCGDKCANWLLYGIQPRDARAGMMPGHCTGKAHKPANLGYSGRRCLVSRKWSGRTLAEHRTQRRNHVLKVLGAVGATVDQTTQDDDQARYRWESVRPTDPDQPDRTDLLLRSIAQHRRWHTQYEQARDQAAHLSATPQHGRAA